MTAAGSPAPRPTPAGSGGLRIGVALGVRGRPHWTVPDLHEQWRMAAERGLQSAWFAQGVGADALMLIGAWGNVPGLEIGTAVV
ncbi:MAG TPA: hypothetical protein VHW47_02805, partial [Acidimicrobiales bacterium]|nr:hypothetical protein [Acidimicrobiales bacterium]